MNDQLKLARAMLYVVWRKHWLIFWVTVTICLVGWPIVHILPDVYESKVKVYLDTQSVLGPLLEGLAVGGQDAEEQLDVARRTLLSRTNLEAVAKDVDLDLRANTPEQFEMILEGLLSTISISGSERENIYQISYRHNDPKMAKRVVESLLKTFMESMLKTSRGDTELAHKFLESQIVVYEKKLVEAEEALKAFKRENVGLMPTEAGGYFRQLETAVANLERAQLELREATKRRDDLRKQLLDEKRLIDARTSQQQTPSLRTPLDERLYAMETRLDELQLIYTSSHPDVLSLIESIAQLKQEVAEREVETPVQQGDLLYTNDPVYQELKVEFSRTEAEVSGLKVRVEEYGNHVAKLKEHIDTIPMVEAALAKLNRDYSVNKDNYEALVSRREAAVISRAAELSSDMVHLRIIDPPREPISPVGPNRPLFIILVFGAALGLVCGLIILDAQLRPRFISVDSLRTVTGYPVLGGVTHHLSYAGQRVRRINLQIFSLLLLMFLTLFAVVIAYEAGLLSSLMVYLNIPDIPAFNSLRSLM